MVGGILRVGASTGATGNRVRWNEIPPVVRPNTPPPKLPRTRTEQPKSLDTTLRLATLNIIDGRRNRLEAALCCMKMSNIDIGLLTETKLPESRHTTYHMGYRVESTKGGMKTGGVALVYRDSKGWVLESTRCYGPNVIRSVLVSGNRRWNVIGAYIPPSEVDGVTLGWLAQAKEATSNSRWPTIMLGDFNMDVDNPAGNSDVGVERRIETAALLNSMGLQSMRSCFRQCKKRLGRYWTWKKNRQNNMHGAICDHILSDNRKDFINCQIKTPRFDSDHEMLVATLRLGAIEHHRRYVRSRSIYPIKPIRLGGKQTSYERVTDSKEELGYEIRVRMV